MSDSHFGFRSDSSNQIAAHDRSLSAAPACAGPLDEGIGHSLDHHLSVSVFAEKLIPELALWHLIRGVEKFESLRVNHG
jgi:hypothetical protein